MLNVQSDRHQSRESFPSPSIGTILAIDPAQMGRRYHYEYDNLPVLHRVESEPLQRSPGLQAVLSKNSPAFRRQR